MPLYRPYCLWNAIGRTLVRDIAKVGSIVDICIRIAVAGDIECVERVKPEAKSLLTKRVKVLER